MLIKHKLAINTSVFITSMAAMLLLINLSSSSLQKDIQIVDHISKIEMTILQLRKHEKDFIMRNDTKYIDKFEKSFSTLKELMRETEQELNSIDISNTEVTHLDRILTDYHKSFTALTETKKRIGLTPKSGLYGKLREAVHNAETIIGKSDYQVLSQMLMLRRHEKDFMLRVDDKYVQKFNNGFNLLKTTILKSNIPQSKHASINSALDVYNDAFLALISQQKILGFHANAGLQNEMRETVHRVDKVLNSLAKNINNAVTEYIRFMQLLTYSLFSLAITIAVLISWFIGKGIISAVSSLKSSMVEASETNNLTIHVESKNNDELGNMGTAFNQMICSFHDVIASVKETVISVHNSTDTLSENSQQTSVGVASQMQETDMVATAVTEMVATIEEIASNTTDTADKAQQANINAGKGSQGVQTTISQISALSDKLVESEKVVNDLSKDSQTIGSVVEVIRAIAEQTNLLALNAAIEAARAGEQGRGFAVVADEVRSLASRTQESTKEIETIIGTLQTRTTDIVSLMKECRDEGEESRNQASEAGRIIEEINTDIVNILDMTNAISTAVQEQSAVASEVNEHVIAIRDVTETANSSVQKNERMSQDLSQQARSLTKEIEKFKV